MANTLEFKLLPTQSAFRKGLTKYRAYIGGVGSGKTFIGCETTLEEALKSPNTLHLIARKTVPELRDSTRRTFLEICPDSCIKQVHIAENRVVINCINGGTAEVIFRPLDDVRKLTGINLATAYVDEASEVDERDWMMIINRLREPHGSRRAWITTNPPTMQHWIYQWFVKNDDESYKTYHATTYENHHLPDDYVTQLEKDYQYNQSWLNRYLLGQFGTLIEGAPVYTNFRADRNVRDLTYIPGRPVYRGWDFGYAHPAVVWAQIDGDGRLCVMHELMGNQEYLDDFGMKVLSLSNEWFPNADFRDFGDIAGTHKHSTSDETDIDILRRMGINCRCQYAYVMSGVKTINQKCGTMVGDYPTVTVSPECPTLIDGFNGGYHFGKDQQGNVSEEPKKDGFYDNLLDALRYLVIHVWDMVDDREWDDLKISEPAYSFNP